MEAAARSRLHLELDLSREGKQTGFIRVPHSVHRSAYGWLPIPVACISNGAGPHVPDPAGMEKLLGMMKAFGAPIGFVGGALQGQDLTLTAAAQRQGVVSV